MKLEADKHYKVKSVGKRDAYYTPRGGIRGTIVSPIGDFGRWTDNGYIYGDFVIIKGNDRLKGSMTNFHEVGLVEV